MAEFSEVIKQARRMCDSMPCRECKIYQLCEERSTYCQSFIFHNPLKAEEIIMAWAAEHPEPVYPTWREYLTSIGVIPKAVILATEKDEFNTFGDWEEACALTNKRIPPTSRRSWGLNRRKRRSY